MFSNAVLTVLQNAGWSVDRRVATAHWVRQLATEGFNILPEAVAIMQSFGGLRIEPARNADSVYTPEPLMFDPIWASGEWDRVQYWEEKLGLKLTPIAWIGGGAMVLIAENGKVYSCRDQTLWLKGESFHEAMEQTLICGHRRPLEVGEMEDRIPRIHMDFNGYSLTSTYTLEDIARQRLKLHSGMRCVFYDFDVVDGVSGLLHTAGQIWWDADSGRFMLDMRTVDFQFTPDG